MIFSLVAPPVSFNGVCAETKQRQVFCIYSGFRLNAKMYGWKPCVWHKMSQNFIEFLFFALSECRKNMYLMHTSLRFILWTVHFIFFGQFLFYGYDKQQKSISETHAYHSVLEPWLLLSRLRLFAFENTKQPTVLQLHCPSIVSDIIFVFHFV